MLRGQTWQVVSEDGRGEVGQPGSQSRDEGDDLTDGGQAEQLERLEQEAVRQSRCRARELLRQLTEHGGVADWQTQALGNELLRLAADVEGLHALVHQLVRDQPQPVVRPACVKS